MREAWIDEIESMSHSPRAGFRVELRDDLVNAWRDNREPLSAVAGSEEGERGASRRRRVILVAAASVALAVGAGALLAARGGDRDDDVESSADPVLAGRLTSTRWLIDDVDGVIPGSPTAAYLDFSPDRTVSGSDGCTSIAGTWKITAAATLAVRVDEPSSSCPTGDLSIAGDVGIAGHRMTITAGPRSLTAIAMADLDRASSEDLIGMWSTPTSQRSGAYAVDLEADGTVIVDIVPDRRCPGGWSTDAERVRVNLLAVDGCSDAELGQLTGGFVGDMRVVAAVSSLWAWPIDDPEAIVRLIEATPMSDPVPEGAVSYWVVDEFDGQPVRATSPPLLFVHDPETGPVVIGFDGCNHRSLRARWVGDELWLGGDPPAAPENRESDVECEASMGPVVWPDSTASFDGSSLRFSVGGAIAVAHRFEQVPVGSIVGAWESPGTGLGVEFRPDGTLFFEPCGVVGTWELTGGESRLASLERRIDADEECILANTLGGPEVSDPDGYLWQALLDQLSYTVEVWRNANGELWFVGGPVSGYSRLVPANGDA